MDNVAAVRRVFEEAWNRGRFDQLDAMLAGQFDFHVRGRSVQMTPQQLADIVRGWRAGFPDLEFVVHTIVASGDHAAAHATLEGTHEGTWRGLSATGRKIDVEHMFFFRLEEGRIVEVWELLDESALSQQLQSNG